MEARIHPHAKNGNDVPITVLGEEILFALTSQSVNVCRATKRKIFSILQKRDLSLFRQLSQLRILA